MPPYKEEDLDIGTLKALALLCPAYSRYYYHFRNKLASIRINIQVIKLAQTTQERIDALARIEKSTADLISILERVDL